MSRHVHRKRDGRNVIIEKSKSYNGKGKNLREVDNYDHNKFDRKLKNSLAAEQEKIDQRWMAQHGEMLIAKREEVEGALPYLKASDREIIERFLAIVDKNKGQDGKNKM